MSNQSIFKEKLIDYDYLKQKVDNKRRKRTKMERRDIFKQYIKQ